MFTQLFPSTYPFIEFSIDPVVNDESMVEVLVELAITFSFVARVGKAAGNEGYITILDSRIENDFSSRKNIWHLISMVKIYLHYFQGLDI